MRRGLLAAGGTLLAAVIARNWVHSPAVPPQAADQPAEPAPRAIGDLAPHLPTALPTLAFVNADGTRKTLADYAGHGVVLNFWATWCTPCVSEMPSLDALARTLAGGRPPMAVLAVSLDRGGAGAVAAFYASHGIRSLPVLLDPHSETMMALKLDGIPTTLVVDRNGREVARIQGAVQWDTSEAAAKLRRLAA
nr:TlpA disulfide reductase family protein [uncultured Lichenicoccus sp.]